MEKEKKKIKKCWTEATGNPGTATIAAVLLSVIPAEYFWVLGCDLYQQNCEEVSAGRNDLRFFPQYNCICIQYLCLCMQCSTHQDCSYFPSSLAEVYSIDMASVYSHDVNYKSKQ